VANVHRLFGVVIIGSPVGGIIEVVVCPAIQDAIVADALPYRGCRTRAAGVSWCSRCFTREAYVSLPNPESMSLSSDSLMDQCESDTLEDETLTTGTCSISYSCGTSALGGDAAGGDAAGGDAAGGDAAGADVDDPSPAMTTKLLQSCWRYKELYCKSLVAQQSSFARWLGVIRWWLEFNGAETPTYATGVHASLSGR
jgi:hypothetical protein